MKWSLLHKNSVQNVEETAKVKCQEKELKCLMGLNQGSTVRSVTWEKAQKISNPFKQYGSFPSSKKRLREKTFLVKMFFFCMKIKKNLRINSFAHNFALKQRLEAIETKLLEFDSALYQYTTGKRERKLCKRLHFTKQLTCSRQWMLHKSSYKTIICWRKHKLWMYSCFYTCNAFEPPV